MSRWQDDAEFCELARHHPRREAMKDAYKAYRDTAAIRPPLSVIIAKLQEAARVLCWTPERRCYIPLLGTWLRAERWDDDYGTRTAAQQAQAEQAEHRVEQMRASSVAAGEQRLRDLSARKARAQQAGPRLVVRRQAPEAVADLLGDVVTHLRKSA